VNNFISKARFITLGIAVAFVPFSVRFCHWALLLFLIICIAEGNFAEKAKVIVRNPLAWILPVFFLLYLAGVFYSSNESNAWSNLDKKIAFILAPLVVVSANPFTKTELRRIAWIFVASCFIGTVICFANAAVVSSSGRPLWNFGPEQPYIALHPDASVLWHYFSYMGFSSGIDIHPTYLALYLYVCVLILLRRLMAKFRWSYVALVVYFLVIIVLLSSRIIVLMTALTIVGVMATSGIRKSWLIGVSALIIIAATLTINPVAQYRNTQEYRKSSFSWPPAALSDNPISIRVSLWWLSLKAMGEVNPVIGTGSGDVNDTMVALSEKYGVRNVLNTSDPHNQYLHTFIALGGLGLAWLLVVFAAPLVILARQREFLACAGLVSFMCVCMTESALELQKGIVLFSLFVSLAGNVAREWRFSIQRLKYA
jgi:O-antigen ligase